jgi:hypothetical protein
MEGSSPDPFQGKAYYPRILTEELGEGEGEGKTCHSVSEQRLDHETSAI